MSIIGDLTAYIAQLEQRLARLEIVEYNNTAAVSFGNPTASLGLTAINGVATTAMRSDAAPALSQSIAPTWTAAHIWTAASSPITITQGIATSGSPYAMTITGGAHTTLAASTEAIDVNINLARTVQFATGALTTQRAMVVQAPTYAFVAASTITTAATLAITNAPQAGSNATITLPLAFWIQNGSAVFFDNYATNPSFTFRRADGTSGAPTKVLSGEVLGIIGARGYGATGFSTANKARIDLNAAEDWSDTAQGTYIGFRTTLKTTTTMAEVMRLDDAGNISVLKGLITQYNNIATAGYGVPAIVSRVGSTGNTAAIADTNFSNAGTAGEYLVSYYIVVTTADAASTATLQVQIKWNDGTVARSFNSLSISTTATNYKQDMQPYIRLGSGNVTYGVTVTGSIGTAQYALYAICIRLN